MKYPSPSSNCRAWHQQCQGHGFNSKAKNDQMYTSNAMQVTLDKRKCKYYPEAWSTGNCFSLYSFLGLANVNYCSIKAEKTVVNQDSNIWLHLQLIQLSMIHYGCYICHFVFSSRFSNIYLRPNVCCVYCMFSKLAGLVQGFERFNKHFMTCLWRKLDQKRASKEDIHGRALLC